MPSTSDPDAAAEPAAGYALYARTSTERQRDQETIASQVAALRDHCVRTGREIVAEFVDDGISGTFLNRPGLNALREAARQGHFQAVLCWDLDRLGRAELIEMLALRKELTTLGVPLIEGRSGRDLAANDQYSELLFILDAWKANSERIQILERTSRGKRRAVSEGRWGGGVVPYGYSVENRRLVVDEEEARIVRLIYDWSVEGVSASETAARLNARGVVPKMTKTGQADRRRVTPSGRWSQAQVTSILRNRTYAGTLVWGRRTQKGYSGGEPITVECPAIVTSEQWLTAREAVESRRRFKCARDEGKYPLRGLIRCGLCGRTYVGITNRNHRYYRCSAISHPELLGGRCTAKSIRSDWLEEHVWAQIASLLANPHNVRRYIQSVAAASKPLDPDPLESIAIAEQSLQKQADQLVHELGTEDSTFVRQRIRTRLSEIEQELVALQSERAGLLDRAEELRREEQRAKVAVNVLEGLRDSLLDPSNEQRMTALRSLVSSIGIEETASARIVRVTLRLVSGAEAAQATVMSGIHVDLPV
jgi:site-specific DNA recombinase